MTTPKTQTNNCLGTIALAALVGGLAGAVVGLMFAPKRGKDLRQDVWKMAKNFNHRSEDISGAKKTGYITLNNPKVTQTVAPPT